jgi:hypothetical protein
MQDASSQPIVWSVEYKGVTLRWSIEPARIRHQVTLVRETTGPQADGLSNFIYRFADTLAAPFDTTEDGVLTGIARDLLLAVAVQRHPKWFDGGAAEGGAPALRFSIDPGVSLYTAALQPGSIAIDRV